MFEGLTQNALYRVGIYIRLSKEDNERMYNLSKSENENFYKSMGFENKGKFYIKRGKRIWHRFIILMKE